MSCICSAYQPCYLIWKMSSVGGGCAAEACLGSERPTAGLRHLGSARLLDGLERMQLLHFQRRGALGVGGGHYTRARPLLLEDNERLDAGYSSLAIGSSTLASLRS